MVFAAAFTVTVPLPEPLAPPATVTQPAPLVADQPHPVVVVTARLAGPPPAATACVEGEMVNVQFAPDWVTVNVCPAMVSVPVRGVVAVVAATAKLTVPIPEPEALEVTDSQDALLTALHAHPDPAVTARLALPPGAANDCVVVEIEGAHGAVNANVLDSALAARPPGPTADTRVS